MCESVCQLFAPRLELLELDIPRAVRIHRRHRRLELPTRELLAARLPVQRGELRAVQNAAPVLVTPASHVTIMSAQKAHGAGQLHDDHSGRVAACHLVSSTVSSSRGHHAYTAHLSVSHRVDVVEPLPCSASCRRGDHSKQPAALARVAESKNNVLSFSSAASVRLAVPSYIDNR